MIDQVQNRLPENTLYKCLGRICNCDRVIYAVTCEIMMGSWKARDQERGDRRYLADGDGHMEPGYVDSSPVPDRSRKLAAHDSQTPQVNCGVQAKCWLRQTPRRCCSLVDDADLRPAVTRTN